MGKDYRRALNRSYDWIRANPGATNLDVPDSFVAEWMFEEYGDEPRPKGFFYSVFAFGYMHCDLLKSGDAEEVSHSIPAERLGEFFDRWQMKLALVEVHRVTTVKVDPLPLFQFPEEEEIRYRAHDGQPI